MRSAHSLRSLTLFTFISFTSLPLRPRDSVTWVWSQPSSCLVTVAAVNAVSSLGRKRPCVGEWKTTHSRSSSLRSWYCSCVRPFHSHRSFMVLTYYFIRREHWVVRSVWNRSDGPHSVNGTWTWRCQVLRSS